ncbi:selenium metabolism-associated LysR family transcriptional regulator [Zhaonella formicivorans]|uniref:selenium metabolism-associated LysR family transcriptional regulator n=1 Tax=Zhaonella formicivorans TaxID=2528593 RepID=UPI001D126A5F|nr:selenium metabolism-associated LysR family transcriptional regulator [Zhaonella formicivorans]
MDDRFLVFKTVADKKSFSQAAKHLHLSQPAISLQIQSLEEFYGTKLFDRTNKRVVLTEAGRILYEYVEQFTELHEQAKKSISEATGMVKGRLHLGATLTIGEYLLPKVIGLFVKDHPNVNFSMVIANTEQIMQKLLENNLDLGVIEGPVDHPNLIKEEFLRDELVIIVPPAHPWAKRKEIELNELLQESLILRESGSGTRMVMEARLKETGVDPAKIKIAMELGSTQSVKEAVLSGLGISIVSACTIQREIKFGLLKVVRIKNVRFPRSLNIFYNKNKFRTVTVDAFLELLRSSAIKKMLELPLD